MECLEKVNFLSVFIGWIILEELCLVGFWFVYKRGGYGEV